MRLQRLARILYVSWKNGLLTMLVEAEPEGRVARWAGFYARRRHFSKPRDVRLREALESLGPIFVKFGQMLSTRRDLLAPDFADELGILIRRQALCAVAERLGRIVMHLDNQAVRACRNRRGVSSSAALININSLTTARGSTASRSTTRGSFKNSRWSICACGIGRLITISSSVYAK